MYFVNQKKHRAGGAWDNNVHTKDTLDAAMHQFHAFMSTYAYGQDANLDYVSCSVEAQDGRIIHGPEVDDNIEPEPEPEVEA